jgi:hypothetical protein
MTVLDRFEDKHEPWQNWFRDSIIWTMDGRRKHGQWPNCRRITEQSVLWKDLQWSTTGGRTYFARDGHGEVYDDYDSVRASLLHQRRTKSCYCTDESTVLPSLLIFRVLWINVDCKSFKCSSHEICFRHMGGVCRRPSHSRRHLAAFINMLLHDKYIYGSSVNKDN